MSDQTPPAGATPAVADATSAQTTPTSPAAPPTPTPPATGDDALGDAGKRALDAERSARRAAEDRAKAAERERDELKTATLSETEQKIAQAKKDGSAETLLRVQSQIRRTETRAALLAAGINASILDLALKADDFADLTVDDEGAIKDLGTAVEAFKKTHRDFFGQPSGTADGGTRGNPSVLTREQIEKMKPAEINARWEEVSKALGTMT